MTGIVFDSNGRDPSGWAVCSECAYPYRGLRCENPGCRVNMSPEAQAREDARLARAKAHEEEWQRILAIQRRMARR